MTQMLNKQKQVKFFFETLMHTDLMESSATREGK